MHKELYHKDLGSKSRRIKTYRLQYRLDRRMGVGILRHLNDFLGSDVDVYGNYGSNICKRRPIGLKVIVC